MKYQNTAEIERDGGMVWAIDVTGRAWPLTKDEAPGWPGLAKIVPWTREGDEWIAPAL